ncbi:MAG TPA: hypothetical protein VJ908_10095 [Wenzhouxiangellaceae bacterium]|nr:hypothetical protein [Wenzhouxiangellaceae bacterium]
MTSRTALAAAAIIGYYLTTVLAHLEVSLWLVRRRESDLLGSYRFAESLPHAGTLVLAAIVIWQARRAWRGHNHVATFAGWTAWLVAVVLVDRFLIYSFPEYLHYPQYALLAYMIARLADPDRSAFAVGPVLLAVTVLGIADEALQYVWLTISYSNYLDFNDFLLNLLGAAAGLLLHYGFTSSASFDTPAARRNASRAALGFCWLGIVMLLLVAALQVTSGVTGMLHPIERQPSYSSWIPGPHAGRYYVLDPLSGTLILVLTGIAISTSAAPRRN